MASTQVTNMAHDLKKPTSAYWLWLADNRKRVEDVCGSRNGPVVAKKAGEMWKALTDTERQPYERKAKEQKDAYDAFVATDAGKKALSEKKLAKAEAMAEQTKKEDEKAEKVAAKEEKKNERASKAAVKSIEKDDSLKKPQSAYWLWLADNRERIMAMIGTGKGSDVAKKAGEMWKAFSESERQPYEKKAKEQKDAYDKFIASDEGAAKLKAFKEAQQAAKDQFKPKAEAEADENGEEESPPQKKRGATEEGAPPSKRGRGAKTSMPEGPKVPEDVLKEAESMQMDGQLKNLMSRADVVSSGKSPKQMLAALQESGGLVNRAKAALLGA